MMVTAFAPVGCRTWPICLVCRTNLKVPAICTMQDPSDAAGRKFGESRLRVTLSARPIRTTALAQATTVRFTRDVAMRHKNRRMEN